MRIRLCLLAGLLASCNVPGQIAPVVSLDLTGIDKTADPCVDFHQYACGAWFAHNPIPPDQPGWSPFMAVVMQTDSVLRDILESAAKSPGANGVNQKIGAYYAACMDQEQLNRKGPQPLASELARISGISDKQTILLEVADLQQKGTNVLFGFSVDRDSRNGRRMIAVLDQGGFHLPDRDYYAKNDPKSEEVRRGYEVFIGNLFGLAGDSPEVGKQKADIVVKIETALANASLDRASRRDPAKTYHLINEQQLRDLSPSLGWTQYLAAIGVPKRTSLNAADLEFFERLDQLWQTTSLEEWKVYLAWSYIFASRQMLSEAFETETFSFSSRVFGGSKRDEPRWHRCVLFVDQDLGEALGQRYVEKLFGESSKEATKKIVHEVENTLEPDIQNLSWMTPATRVRALQKLHAVSEKIGYPERWRDYSRLLVSRGDALGNWERSKRFEFQRNVARLGKPADRAQWQMTPPTVNAYYDPGTNSINFPAGRLQPPWYDPKADAALNYGGIGSVIGHELTHGFDDQGRKFDADGNLSDWWTKEDATHFSDRADCFVQQYDGYTVAGGAHVNGNLTLGENMADNGGLRLAYLALMASLAGKEQGVRDGYTTAQRFFLNFAQTRCSSERDEFASLLVHVDSHSPGKYRVNGTVSNMTEFQSAFGCKVGQPMVREKACRIW